MQMILPYLMLYKRHKWMLILGVSLTIITSLSNIWLLVTSGWFLSASVLISVDNVYNFNYMLPVLVIRVIAVIRTVTRYFERLVNHDFTFRTLQYIRINILSKLFPLFPAKLVHLYQGELLNTLVADVNTLDHLYLRVLLPLVSSFIVIVIVTIGLSFLNLILAVTLCSLILIILFILPLIFYYIGKSNGQDLVNLRAKYRQQLTIWLQSQSELIIFGANDNYRTQMESIELEWYNVQCCQSELTAIFQAIMMLIGNLAILLVLLVVIKNVEYSQYRGSLISVFVFCALAIFEMFNPIILAFQHLGQVTASILRITQITNSEPEVNFIKAYSETPSQITLNVDQVSFSYTGQLHKALNKVSFSIDAGAHVAILGCTGCGKSTLLQILTRAWDPQEGMITLNNIPLSQFSEKTLRSVMSVVPQRIHLFSATLRDNLLFASPKANDEKLCTILESVGLYKLLHTNGLNGWLGESGRQLSSGELRRLAIARAILHNAPLMLLDEPTEGLDIITEIKIIKLLIEIMRDKTMLMVTHRLYGLDKFDKIIVMDNGQIVEQSHHKDLLLKRGRYYQLRQRLDYI